MGSEKTGKVRAWFRKIDPNSFLFFLMIFFLGLLVGMILTVMGFTIIDSVLNWFPTVKEYSSSDAVSIANTYIVFTTAVFMMFALFATLYTVWFSKWFQQEKTHELRENMRYLATKIRDDDEIRETLVKDVLLQDSVIESLVVIMEEKYRSYMDENFSSIVGDKIDELRNKLLKETCDNLVMEATEKVKRDENFKTELVDRIKQELKERL